MVPQPTLTVETTPPRLWKQRLARDWSLDNATDLRTIAPSLRRNLS